MSARGESEIGALLDTLAMQSRQRAALEQQLAAVGADAFRTIERVSADGKTTTQDRVLTRSGVAALLSDIEGKPVAVGSISRWIKQSQPGGRLADHPFPAPKYDDQNRPYWEKSQAREIVHWYETRPDQRGQYRPPDQAMLSATIAIANPDGSGGRVQEEATSEGLAALLGVSPVMLSRYRTDSRPGEKYADDPFPAGRRGPDGRLRWTPTEVQAAIKWKERNRVGRGVGGGSSAHKNALPRWDPERRLHCWHPSMRRAKPGQTRYCRYCGEGALGKESIGECPGYAPDRAARLSKVRLHKVHGKEGAKLIRPEVQAGLVQLAPAKSKITTFDLTPAGAEWLNQYIEFAQ